MNKLEKKIGYSFKNRQILKNALSHSSYANEKHLENGSYERLEFLGDSILGFVTAEFLYRHVPLLPEGRMTRLRSELVCENSLYNVAQKLGLSEHMLIGRGEERSGGRQRVSVLADMVESLIAAIFIDGGLEEARKFIVSILLEDADLEHGVKPMDYKSRLQEILQRNGEVYITYNEISETGPDHDKSFVFEVVINGKSSGRGDGKTKKEAEQMAAAEALRSIDR